MSAIAFPSDLWQELTEPLALDIETAGVIIARPALSGDRLILLGRKVVWVPDEHYLRRERLALEIASGGYVPALKEAAEDDGVAIFFHTHPGGDPRPSRHDAVVDDELRQPFALRTGSGRYASLILGGTRDRPAFSGKLFSDGEESALARLRVAASTLRILVAGDEAVDEAIYDRQIRAFGREGQRAIKSLHVGVVGAGGTGSAVFEQLVRLGVGEITVIDDDLVTEANLTRIHEAGIADVGSPKVDVTARGAERIGLGTRVHALQGRITDVELARALTGCDVIFGCTDDNRGRAILSRLAYWYLIPVLDTAFLVDTVGERVRGLFARITVVAPGTACLFCRNRIDQAQLAAEALPPPERERLAEEGYVPGLGDPDPSVGAYTTLTASLAVTELLDRLFGLSGEDPPSELLVRLHDRALSTTRAGLSPDHYCGDHESWGRGDTDPFLEQLWA